MAGWIKLHRSLMSHWCSEEPEALAVWVRLLMEANHSTVKKLFNGSLMEIKRGQTLFGLEAFSKKSGVSVAKLRRYLNLFEKEKMISRQKTNKFSLITITCYDDYQSDDRQDAGRSQADRKQNANKSQHYKNDNNGENDKNENKPNRSAKALDFSAWPQMPSDQVLADYKKLRAAKKASFTQTVINSMGKHLQELSLSSVSVDQALTICCERGWQGFKAEWVINHLNDNQKFTGGSKDIRNQQMIEDRNKQLGITQNQPTFLDYIDSEATTHD